MPSNYAHQRDNATNNHTSNLQDHKSTTCDSEKSAQKIANKTETGTLNQQITSLNSNQDKYEWPQHIFTQTQCLF